MRKLLLIAPLVGTLILTGAMVSNVLAIEILTEEDVTQEVVSKEYVGKTADNFIILFDTSKSMAEPFKKGGAQTQYDVAIDLLKKGNTRLPDLDYNGSFYIFSPKKFIYPMGPYDKAQFGHSLPEKP